MKHGGGYLTTSWAKSGRRFYWKPNARGLNNLKGRAVNVTTALKWGGPLVSVAWDTPDIIRAYKHNAHEGNKKLAGTAGSVAGGWVGGMFAGALYFGIIGSETGPFDVIFIFVGGVIGAAVGREGVERLYDKITKHD